MIVKPTIVILHGWGLSKKRFSPLISELEILGYTVYAPDFPGFGESSAPDKPYYLNDYVTFLSDMLQKKQIRNPIFIAHSFGGRVALRYCRMNQNNVRTLILTGTPGFSPVLNIKRLFLITLAKIGKLLFSIPVFSSFMTVFRKKYYSMVGANEYNTARGTMKDTFKNIVSESLINDMKLIDVPTFLVWGQEDHMVPITIAKRMNATIHNSHLLIIPNANHGVPYNQPKIFVEAILKILNR